MDFDSSSKFISSLAKFLQSLCNGYVEFDNGVEVIGHIYLNVDTGKKIDYVLNEKVCKTDQNSVTFISNSFHAQPAEKPKPVEKPKPKAPTPTPEEDTDEIILMDEPEQSHEQYNDNVQHNSTPKPKPPRSHGASKRSYSQSFSSHPHRSSKASKFDSTSSSSNPNGAQLSINNSANDSSFNVSGNITAASESDLSHLSQVFPESVDPSNSQDRDIKPVLDKDLNVIKQEYDPSAEVQPEGGGSYDDPGETSYYSQDQSYESGNEYYGSGHQNSNQRSDYDPSKMYLGGEGGSGTAGDAQVAFSMRMAPSTGKLLCPICNTKFKNKRDLDGHINVRHLGRKPHLCPRCNKGYAYKQSLNGNKWSCWLCNKEFDRKYRLTDHIKGVHDRLLGCFCSVCGKEFSYKKNLNRHLAKCHGYTF